jgi:hypothetical protein
VRSFLHFEQDKRFLSNLVEHKLLFLIAVLALLPSVTPIFSASSQVSCFMSGVYGVRGLRLLETMNSGETTEFEVYVCLKQRVEGKQQSRGIQTGFQLVSNLHTSSPPSQIPGPRLLLSSQIFVQASRGFHVPRIQTLVSQNCSVARILLNKPRTEFHVH